MMRIKCLSCEVLARPIYACAASSPHIVDIQLFRRGLHNTPLVLRGYLQEHIDQASAQGYDAVIMGYGLCGQATAGLVAGAAPVVIPRAHDCITLFLGGRERYNQQFEQTPGTFWYAQDYIERDDGAGGNMGLGSGLGNNGQDVYQEYVEKYGQENADYLMEVMGAWQSHYQRAAYIDMGVGDGSRVEAKARDDANRRGWLFERIIGDLVLIRRLVHGDWNDDFLVLQPGEKTKVSYDESIIACVLAG